MSAKPVVLPEVFSGTGEWVEHFENVAAVNKWTAAEQLLWLKVRLSGRAQAAFKRFNEADREDVWKALAALKDRFEPKSKKDFYMAEFQCRRKETYRRLG